MDDVHNNNSLKNDRIAYNPVVLISYRA